MNKAGERHRGPKYLSPRCVIGEIDLKGHTHSLISLARITRVVLNPFLKHMAYYDRLLLNFVAIPIFRRILLAKPGTQSYSLLHSSLD